MECAASLLATWTLPSLLCDLGKATVSTMEPGTSSYSASSCCGRILCFAVACVSDMIPARAWPTGDLDESFSELQLRVQLQPQGLAVHLSAVERLVFLGGPVVHWHPRRAPHRPGRCPERL